MLKTVTFTGIDNKTDFNELLVLQKRYPFIEFGLLASVKNTNNNINNRYPDLSILEKLKPKELKLALHMCGSGARSIMQEDNWQPFYNLVGYYLFYFSRIQLNVSALENYLNDVMFPFSQNLDFIIQSKTSNMSMYETYKDVPNVYGFQDNSGGLGKKETSWLSTNNSLFGYAGGIDKDNVLETIDSISKVCKGDFWIDMESSVRTDDWFDTEKCWIICEKIKRNYFW